MDVEFNDALLSLETRVSLCIRSQDRGVFIHRHVDNALTHLNPLILQAFIVDPDNFWNKLRRIPFFQHQNSSIHREVFADEVHDAVQEFS
ncbi:hypothetical protein ES703_93458 [subsurface metagenome]